MMKNLVEKVVKATRRRTTRFKLQRLLLLLTVAVSLSIASLLVGFYVLRQRQLIRLRPQVRAEKFGHRLVEVHGQYIAIKNFIGRTGQAAAAAADQVNNPHSHQVTLSTTSTPEFLHHLPELTRRWGPEGLISVSVYVPGTDYLQATAIIARLRHCSAAIRRQVDWHLVYDRAHPPKGLNLSSLSAETTFDEEAIRISTSYDESYFRYHGHQRCSCRQPDLAKCLKHNAALAPSYKRRHSLLYPINVLRNVARSAAPTRYLLASDIELYPSRGLAKAFSIFIKDFELKEAASQKPPRRVVFMLPIFEVNATTLPLAPETKSQLVAAFERGDAQFFHAAICDECQRFPGRGDWITTLSGTADDEVNPEPISIFGVTKRTGALGLRHWEPIYIGTHAEPLYDERLSWEGKLDKMSQMYELCLLDYDILILDNAFIVHAPGIKLFDPEDVKARAPAVEVNRARYEEAIWSLRLLYGAFTTVCD